VVELALMPTSDTVAATATKVAPNQRNARRQEEDTLIILTSGIIPVPPMM
jgi:hypothetical protein